MNPKQRILSLQTDRNSRSALIDYFSKNKSTVEELITISTTKDVYPYQEYATWILSHVTKIKTQEVNAFQPQLIDAFLASDNQSCLRNICGVLKQLPIIDYKEGELLESLISHLKNESNKVALHVYSLYKLVQFAEKYHELTPEILQIMDIKKTLGLPPSIAVANKYLVKLVKKKTS